MDESELEARLRRRLHERFDGQRASSELRDALVAAAATAPAATRARLAPASLVPASRQLLAVAAVLVIVVVAAIAILGREGSVGVPPPSVYPAVSPSASPSAPAAGEVSPSANPSVPAPSVPPVSSAAWSSLDFRALSGVPVISSVVAWSGGYVAIAGATSSALLTAWTSVDGRTWTALPAATFGLDDPSGNTFVVGGSTCGSGVVVVAEDASGTGTLWTSTDGSTWRHEAMPGGKLSQVRQGLIAGTSTGAVIASETGPAVAVTMDCTTWRKVSLPGPSTTQVTAVAAFGTGYVALDASSQAPASQPRAWSSSDGATWAPATVQAAPGHDFSQVWTGAGGLIAESHFGGTPGLDALWSSADGRAWRINAGLDPLGQITSGEGQGDPAGVLTGDGTRFVAWGSPSDDLAGAAEYWTSSDGVHWTRLQTSGSGPSEPLGGNQLFLLRDGILISGDAGTWFAAATAN